MGKVVGRVARVAMLGGFVLALGACAVDQSGDDEERVSGVASELDDGEEPAGDDDGAIDAPPGSSFAEPPPSKPGCNLGINPGKELLVRHLGVVEDPVRTRWSGKTYDRKDGAWTFGRLMTQMAGPNDPDRFVRSWLARWETNRTVNGFLVPARPRISTVLGAWPKLPGGQLDLTKSPLRLLAIVNRMDLRNAKKKNAGEGRFVFGVTDAAGNPREFTVILEYKLPATTPAEGQEWARQWHALGDLTPGTEEYNDALEKITDRFTKRDANPARPNGSSIGQVRTNEIALANTWELREFRLNTNGWLVHSTVKQTPSPGQRNSKRIGDWINDHESEILGGRHFLKRDTDDYQPIRGGRSLADFTVLNPPGVKNKEARHLFAVKTCDGCHSVETGTSFLHIGNRSKGEMASLSAFLTGTTVADPVTGETRKFDDLARRRADFRNYICTGEIAPAGAAARIH